MFEIRASTLARFMQCPGFKLFKDLPVSPTNDAAMEGTAAGELLQAMVEQRTLNPVVNKAASNGVLFNEDMYFHLRPIADKMLEECVDQPIECETRIDWMTPDGEYKIRGQFDQAFMVENTLYVQDLKYGFGLVEVKENYQLLAYAIGYCNLKSVAPETIRFTINQPRAYHEDGTVRHWTITYGELIGYYKRICDRLKGTDLVTGPSCKYCPAAAICTAFNRAANNALDVVHSEFIQDDLINEDIGPQLDLYSRAMEIIKIKYDSLKTLAVDRLQKNGTIEGYSMVESFGIRQWKDDVDPKDIEVITGLKLTKEELVSPAQAEKLGADKSLVEFYTIRKSKGFDLKLTNVNKKAEKVFGKKG